MVTTAQLKHFRNRLDEIKKEKCKQINELYPVDSWEFVKWVDEGHGRLKAEGEIREHIIKHGGSIGICDVFDFTDMTSSLKDADEFNKIKRKKALAELEAVYQKLLDQAVFGEDAEALFEMLDNFRAAKVQKV